MALPSLQASARPPWDWRMRLWWLLWSRCPGVGPQRLASLLNGFGNLELAWKASSALLASRCHWPDPLLASVSAYQQQWGPDPLPQVAHRWRWGRQVLMPGDHRWPPKMLQAQPAPSALYWSGRGSLWRHLAERQAIAVVGTRRPSRHGLHVARQIGAVLAEGGWPVVSGLAEGIDGAVHGGCLESEGVPIGVLGTPLARVYPRHHASLQAAVELHGLLLTELPPGASVSRGSFALRNRLQVALASAVILVECPHGSGALHSAELAWREGLPLWVVPADTGRPSAEGSNSLLARGATPLTRPDELLASLGRGPLLRPSSPRRQEPPARGQPKGSMADRLLVALGAGATMEELCTTLESSPQALLPHLLDLEVNGAVVMEPGLYWRPS